MTTPIDENTQKEDTELAKRAKHDPTFVLTYQKLLSYQNFVKLVVLIGTVFSAIFWGTLRVEDWLDKRIEKSINAAIDGRLNSNLKLLADNGADITLLKLAESRTQVYISNNSYRLNYHERVMRDIVGYLHNRPPHDFIKPEELGFEDFKEK